MEALPSGTVDLVVTSPPYPMIEMWDSMFIGQNVEIGQALEKGDGSAAFEMMHVELDAVWQEVWRILKQGGIACIMSEMRPAQSPTVSCCILIIPGF